MNRFSDETESLLRSAGWFPGRAVPELVSKWQQEFRRTGFPMTDPARKILNEFGGLTIVSEGPGITCARTSIVADPLLGICEQERFLTFYTSLRDKALFPIGETCGGHMYLVVDQDGNTYEVMDLVFDVGSSFDEALENLLLGRKRKLLENIFA